MEAFFQNVYDFFSSNIIVVTVVLVLGVIATILEKSSKITTPITSIIKKYKEKKRLQDERWEKIDKVITGQEAIQKQLQEIERVVGRPSQPYPIVYHDAVEKLEDLDHKIDHIGNQVFENEQDRLRGELFNCGNRCRRGIPLTLEEYRFISQEYDRYSHELHCNGIGKLEFQFITDYFNNQTL